METNPESSDIESSSQHMCPKEKFPKPKFGHMCCELDSMSELSGFVYIKSHVILHVNSKAQKVN